MEQQGAAPQASILAGLDDIQTPDMVPDGGQFQFSLGQSTAAAFRQAWNQGPVSSLADLAVAGIERTGLDPVDSRMLGVDEANAAGKDLGLSFNQPVTQRYFNILASEKRSRMYNDALAAGGRQGIVGKTSRFLGQTAAFGVDPANLLVSALLPNVGAALMARTLAPETVLTGAAYLMKGRSVVRGAVGAAGVNLAERAAVGAAEGAGTAAAVEPLTYAGAHVRQDDDYTLTSSLMNMVAGGAFGMGLHVAGGLLGQVFGRKLAETRMQATKPDNPAPTPRNLTEALAQAPQAVKTEAMQTAVQQAAAGREVNVQDAMAKLPQRPNKPLLGNIQKIEPVSPLSEPMTVRYELMDMKDIRNSNPHLMETPAEMETFEVGVRQHAQVLMPERMGESVDNGFGAPVVDEQGRVLGHQADIRALERANRYNYATARKYRTFLENRVGAEALRGMDEPVLVRRVVPDDTPYMQDNAPRATPYNMHDVMPEHVPFDRNNPKHVELEVGHKVSSLNQRIRELGGIDVGNESLGAELRDATRGNKGLLMGLWRKGGSTLDELAAHLEEEGYLRPRGGNDRVMPEDVLHAIARDAGGERVWPEEVNYQLASRELEQHYADMADRPPMETGAVDGDPTVMAADMEAADTLLTASEPTPEESIDELARILGEPDAATKAALENADARINSEGDIRKAIEAATRCVLGNM